MPSFAHRYTADAWGNFHAERFGLIGHDSTDVAAWLAAHPEFNGSIFFDYGNDEPEIEVTEVFFPEPDDDSEAPSILHHEAANV
jgi:hypothetical protein